MKSGFVPVALFVAALFFAPLAAFAQDSGASDYPQRLELARKMAAIRPVQAQIEQVLDQVILSLPVKDQTAFRAQIVTAFDFVKMGEVSARAMADVYTLPEMQRMIDYYSSPEAQSIEKKTPQYEEKIKPELSKFLDQALMTARTGGVAPGTSSGTQTQAPSHPAPPAGGPGDRPSLFVSPSERPSLYIPPSAGKP